MELIGKIENRKIYYIQIRNNLKWIKAVPKRVWIVFTIANEEDEELIPKIVKECLDRNVSYSCSAGNYAKMTEEFFDEEIAWRGVKQEMKTKKEFDYNFSPVTTAHKNFGEGFWFATTLANDDKFDIDKVICLDFTRKKVKKNLKNLIHKINRGWLPSNEQFKNAEYDK